MVLKHDLFNIVNVAIMLNEPIVIVEGKDDYQIYQHIAEEINPKIQVYQVNEFENYEEGCTGVIKCIEVLQPKFDERVGNVKKVLGIIDRDVRHFRGELPTHLKGLFITKHYSIETYFATRENLRKLISKISYSPLQDITNEILAFVESNFQNSLESLYLLSLEALKNACIQDYEAKVEYDFSPAKISASHFLENVTPQLDAKTADLVVFAQSKNVSIQDIKLIAKGKWYLYWFVNQCYTKIKELKENCQNASITQCRSCKVGNQHNCLFKLKQETYRIEILQDDMLSFIDKEECADIIEVIKSLS